MAHSRALGPGHTVPYVVHTVGAQIRTLHNYYDSLGTGPFIDYVRTKGGGSSLLYISIAYYMQKGGGGRRGSK